MKKFFSLLLLIAAMVCTASAQDMQMPPIPKDPAVRMGKLENGLAYYLRYNNWPENRANFYIAQRVGSLQEEDSQRGLAHFLEHMCFNGSDHFQDNGVIRFCESLGVKFGGDLNAYTSIEETVYNIDNVPTTVSAEQLDSCLLILYDWANGLTLAPAEIDKERGVIHEEWRMRTSGQMRMLERQLPRLYPGSKYGYRFPIGTMEVIDNFKYQELRDYYEKWYNPENQAIIIVGDIDVDKTEARIKELFSGIKAGENAGKVEPVEVADNEEPIIVIDKDKEQQSNLVSVMLKHEAITNAEKANMDYLILDYMRDAIAYMLNQRFNELTLKADCPFLGADASDGNYLFAKSKGAFSLDAEAKEGQQKEALVALLTEARRAREFGFTASEYERFKSEYISMLDNALANKEKRYSKTFCEEYYRNYLDNEPMMAIEDEVEVKKQIISMLPVDAINGLMQQLINLDGRNMVVLNLNVEKDGLEYPTEDSMKAALVEAAQSSVEAFVDNVKNEPLVAKLPKKGKIKKEVKNEKLGYTELQLSNGAKVILKKTDYKADQVAFTAKGKGGWTGYADSDYASIEMFDRAPVSLGGFSTNELIKALAGKKAGVSSSLGQTVFNLSGQAAPQDMETLMQLIYLNFTAVDKDQEAFDNVMRQMEVQLQNSKTVPESAFGDSLGVTMTSHNPRLRPMEVEDLKDVNYDRIIQMAREQTKSAAGFVFTFVGNYDEETIRPLIEQYIASLPGKKGMAQCSRIDSDPKQDVTCRFTRKMETPKAMDYTFWISSSIPFTLENRVRCDMAAQVLSMVYLKKIREDASAAYSCGAQSVEGYVKDWHRLGILAYCPMQPEKSDIAIDILRAEVPAMANECDEDMFQKVKEYMLKKADDQVKTNGYWLSCINEFNETGRDTHTEYRSLIEKQTAQDVMDFVRELMKTAVRIETIMLPEE